MPDFKVTTSTLNLTALVRPGLTRALEHTVAVIGKRAADTAPYYTGRLSRSMTTDVDSATLTAAVGFTDSKAIGAHEEMHDHVIKSGKRPKFLELALHENRDVLAAEAAVELRKVFKK